MRHGQNVVVASILLTTWLVGCTQLPKWDNPFSQPDASYKSQYGMTPQQQVNRLRQLAQSAATMGLDEQSRVSNELYQSYSTTSDPILRRETVRTLGAFSVSEAAAGLQAATEDDEPTVRMSACEAWAQRQGPEATAALAGLLKNDPNVDVRLAASSALASFQSPIAVQELAGVLEDRDPAIQMAAIDALRATTGQDLGNDINQWSDYVKKTLPTGPLDDPSDPSMIADQNLDAPIAR